MKKRVILVVTLFLISAITYAQTIENVDYISEFNNGVAAIKKNNQWAFIKKEGHIVVDFRTDLATTKFDNANYPIFMNGRCIIKKEKDGILYFGYIDISGRTIIEPQYLNASNFINNEAMVLKLVKEEAGKNKVLGKNIVYYKYFEVTIDPNGNIKNYLTPKGFNVVLSKQHLRTPPRITSKRISDNLYAILDKNNKWSIKIIKAESNSE